ncbi:MAG: site-2 protease family protein, partial [Desulfurococcaceae archaeon]
VIFMKGLPPSRKSQALLGLMGPLMGFIAALCMGFLGVSLSKYISIDEARELVSSGEASPIMFYPLAISILESLKGISEEYVIVYHPLAFFSLIMFVITFLNLMPVGQLDGGHVIRAFVDSRTYRVIEHLTLLALFTVGLTFLLNGRYGGITYVSLSFILLLLKAITGFKPHPGPANAASLIKAKHLAILLAYGVLLALTVPIPI